MVDKLKYMVARLPLSKSGLPTGEVHYYSEDVNYTSENGEFDPFPIWRISHFLSFVGEEKNATLYGEVLTAEQIICRLEDDLKKHHLEHVKNAYMFTILPIITEAAE